MENKKKHERIYLFSKIVSFAGVFHLQFRMENKTKFIFQNCFFCIAGKKDMINGEACQLSLLRNGIQILEEYQPFVFFTFQK